MISYTLFVLAFLSMCVHGLQINIHSTKSSSMVRDTVQEHFELIVDDILGQHNEDLLSRLSTIIKDPHDMYATLKPQADLILDFNIQDVCVAQMPGMIANQIHEFSNAVYTSVQTVVGQSWKLSDIELRQSILRAISKGYNEDEVIEDLSHTLEMVNMDMTDKLVRVLEEFDMVQQVRSALVSCQSVFAPETSGSIEKSTTTATKDRSFLDTFLLQLTTDLQSQLYNQVSNLAKSVYEDLAFSA